MLAGAVAACWRSRAPAEASPFVRYGLQDDAWLAYGPGTLDERLDSSTGWASTSSATRSTGTRSRRPQGKTNWEHVPTRSCGAWTTRGIVPVVTIWGTPRWANGGRSPNWVPTIEVDVRRRSRAALPTAIRSCSNWLIWNEPNQRRWLRPTSPRVYTQTLLNPALRRHPPRDARREGGRRRDRSARLVPAASRRSTSSAAWTAAGARLDAYAHNPYPLERLETPSSGGCAHCETITMATIDRLLREVWHGVRPRSGSG